MTNEKTSIALREITRETLRDILGLTVAPNQRTLVADNAWSISEAYFEPNAWFRAIYADDTPVGFLMTFEDTERPFYYLWRFMIEEQQQGKGYGRRALELLIERVRGLPNATELMLSVVEREDSAARFYEKLGFVPTGQMHGDETEYRLIL